MSQPHRYLESQNKETLWSYLFASFSRSSYRSSVSWCSRLSLRAHLSLGGWGGKEAVYVSTYLYLLYTRQQMDIAFIHMISQYNAGTIPFSGIQNDNKIF